MFYCVNINFREDTMSIYNNEDWLRNALRYLTQQLELDDNDAQQFLDETKHEPELQIQFDILKEMWSNNIDYVPTKNLWKGIEKNIYTELALKIIIREVIGEHKLPETNRLLNKIKKHIPNEQIIRIKSRVKKLITVNEKDRYLTPGKNLWRSIQSNITADIKSHRKRPISSVKAVASSQRNRYRTSKRTAAYDEDESTPINKVILTILAASAAVIIFFVMLFVTPKNNTTEKIAKDNPGIIIKPFNPDKDNEVEVKADKTGENTFVKGKTRRIPDTPDNNVTPDNQPDKHTPPDSIDKPEKPDESKKTGTPNTTTKYPDKKKPVKKPDGVVSVPKPKNKENVADTSTLVSLDSEYKAFDLAKLKYRLPTYPGVVLNFVQNYDTEEKSHQPVYKDIVFDFPTADGGFVVKLGKKNDIYVDFNRDGKFEKHITKTTTKTLKLNYKQFNRIRYDIKFSFDELTKLWVIQPAGGQTSKKPIFKQCRILLIDANLNGKYNDVGKDIVIFTNTESAQILSEVNYISNEWVKIVPNESGTKINVAKNIKLKYFGYFNIIRNYAKDVKLQKLTITGRKATITLTGKQLANKVKLPIGYYYIVDGIVGNNKKIVEFVGNSNFRIGISWNTTTSIYLGGSLKLRARYSQDSKGRIFMSDRFLLLKGDKSGEIYKWMTEKGGKKKPLAPKEVRVISPDIENCNLKFSFKYLRGYAGSYVQFTKLRTDKRYVITVKESNFSEFLVGKATNSAPIKIKMYKSSSSKRYNPRKSTTPKKN